MKKYPGIFFIWLGALWMMTFSIKASFGFIEGWSNALEYIRLGILTWHTEIAGIFMSAALVNAPGIALLLIGFWRAWHAGVYEGKPKKLILVKIFWWLLWIPILSLIPLLAGLTAR